MLEKVYIFGARFQSTDNLNIYSVCLLFVSFNPIMRKMIMSISFFIVVIFFFLKITDIAYFMFKGWEINPFSAGTDFRRQILTSIDVRIWRLKSIPALNKVKIL